MPDPPSGPPLRATTRPPDRRAILLLTTSFDFVARLHRVLGEAVVLDRQTRVSEALAACAARAPLALVLEPVDVRGNGTVPLLEAARRADAAMPLIALVRRSTGWSAATIALLEAQPTAVFVEEDLDLASVTRLLAGRIQRATFVASAWRELSADVPEALQPLVRHALSRASGPISVESVADELGLHRKTLWSHCRRHGVGSAQAMMTWCRLLAAAHALRASTRPIDAIAEELAFASPTALRNSIRRHLGVTASALRAQGGERLAREGFRRWLRGAPARDATPAATCAGTRGDLLAETLGDVA